MPLHLPRYLTEAELAVVTERLAAQARLEVSAIGEKGVGGGPRVYSVFLLTAE